MELNEIKKELYKQKPQATLVHMRNGSAYYTTVLNGETINFCVPYLDMGDAPFYSSMDAKLLIRWII